MDIITKSPGLHHILENIFMELNQKDLDNCQFVNKMWNNIITNKSLCWYERLLEKSSVLSEEDKTKWKKLIGKLSKCDPNQIEYMKSSHFKDMHAKGWRLTVAEKICTATLNRDVEFIKIIAPIAVNPNAVCHFRIPQESYFYSTPIQVATLRAAANKICSSAKKRKLEVSKCYQKKFGIKKIKLVGRDPVEMTVAENFLQVPECSGTNNSAKITDAEKLEYGDIIRILAPYSEDDPNAPLARNYKAYFNSPRLNYMKIDLKGWTPIQIASIDGNGEIVEILAKFTKYPNAPINEQKLTIIQMAIERGNTDVIRALVPFTENPNAPYANGSVSFENGCTPIQRATSFGYSEIIRILAPLSIRPNAPDPNGFTPLQTAAKNGQVEIFKILLPLSENPNVPDPDGFTLIETAAKHGHLEIIKILAPLSGNPNAPGPNGVTPIHWAAKEGHFEVIKFLVPFSENPNAPDHNGFTPIQTAATFGYYEVVKILVPFCKNPNAPDPNGVTPLEHAEKNDFTEIKEILIPILSKMDDELKDEQDKQEDHDEPVEDITLDEDAELDVDSDDEMLSCAYCDVVFQDYISLNKHVGNTHISEMEIHTT